ncbi:hypothetical protein TCON_1034 [Astathelohania contejeani]|uniref:Uncharacterized protein n=1 Tax=Astathelohania contejeani TaxID=164912 RepID=A0ABQ7I015_9MICR|nr:hypothetical protein TCON_1034 [Thelohania contejeani]
MKKEGPSIKIRKSKMVGNHTKTIFGFFTPGKKEIIISSTTIRKIKVLQSPQPIINLSWSYNGAKLIITSDNGIYILCIFTNKIVFSLVIENLIDAYLLSNYKILCCKKGILSFLNEFNQEELELYCDRYIVYRDCILYQFDGLITIIDYEYHVLHEYRPNFIIETNFYAQLCQNKLLMLNGNKILGKNTSITINENGSYPDKFLITNEHYIIRKNNRVEIYNKRTGEKLDVLPGKEIESNCKDRIYILNNEKFKILQEEEENLNFHMIDKYVYVKEMEEEFDISDESVLNIIDSFEGYVKDFELIK